MRNFNFSDRSNNGSRTYSRFLFYNSDYNNLFNFQIQKNFKIYKNIIRLDRDIITELIDYIEIHENKKITIHFKFMTESNKIRGYVEDENKFNIFAKIKEA